MTSPPGAASLFPSPFPPLCASAWGYDRHSDYPYVDLDARGVAIRLRWIPPGPFMMGSPDGEAGRWEHEGPQHEVRLTRGFWLGETPCTQRQWQAVMGRNPSRFTGEDRPVENVSWDDCQEFCETLRARMGLPGLLPRLPTEAEWEYACRARKESAFSDGSACTKPDGLDPALAKLGWFDKNSGGETHPVAQLARNGWGLCDVHGNVWEWCADWYGPYSGVAQVDPHGPSSGLDRVYRGGCWGGSARYCRSAYRFGWPPDYRFVRLGFRLAAGQPEVSE